MNFSGDGPQPQIVFLILFRGLKEMVHHCRDQFRPIVKTVVVCAGNLYVPSRWFAGLRMRRKDLTWLSYL